MPIIKSAKKRVKQAEKRRQRNYPVRSSMKTHIKKVLLLSKEGKKEEAEKLLPVTYSIIDTAAKKNIIHKKNASRKKSLLARNIANIRASSKGANEVSEAKNKAPEKVVKAEEKVEEKA